MTLSEDPNPEVRQTVRYVYEDEQRGALNLDPPPASSATQPAAQLTEPALPSAQLIASVTDPQRKPPLFPLSSTSEGRLPSTQLIASVSNRWVPQVSLLRPGIPATDPQGNPQPSPMSSGTQQSGAIPATPPPDPQLVAKVVEILKHGNPDSQAVVLPMLAALQSDSPWARQPEVLSALRTLLEQQPRPANYAAVLNAASSFKTLMRETDLQQQVLSGLNDPDPEVQRAAIRVSLEHFLADPQTEPLVNTAFGHLDPSATSILLEEVGDPKFMNRHAGVSGGAISQDQAYFLNKNLVAIKRPTDLLDNPLVLSTVLNSLHNPDNNVRAAGLDTLRKVKGVEQRPEFRTAMEQLQNDSNPRLKLIANSVLEGRKLSEALKDVEPGSVLDFNYFVAKIEPILATQGADGKACVFCHASHVIFKLRPPNDQGVFSDQDSEDNYKYAMHVVDINDPTKSLMLIKPTRPTDSAGNVGDYLATHNGGQRWHGNEESWQYRTILEWIRGERLETGTAAK